MSHRNDQPSHDFAKMRYFAPELVAELNSPDSERVGEAMDRWEHAIDAYRKHLRQAEREMPLESHPLAKLSLHDWSVVQLVPSKDSMDQSGSILSIGVKNEKCWIVLWYLLSQNFSRIDPPAEWPLSEKKVHWLYDELDFADKQQNTLVHRILFSDGTTFAIPFSRCGIIPLKSKHVMSHSELMQIA